MCTRPVRSRCSCPVNPREVRSPWSVPRASTSASLSRRVQSGLRRSPCGSCARETSSEPAESVIEADEPRWSKWRYSISGVEAVELPQANRLTCRTGPTRVRSTDCVDDAPPSVVHAQVRFSNAPT